jgi:chromosome segregation ATPase
MSDRLADLASTNPAATGSRPVADDPAALRERIRAALAHADAHLGHIPQGYALLREAHDALAAAERELAEHDECVATMGEQLAAEYDRAERAEARVRELDAALDELEREAEADEQWQMLDLIRWHRSPTATAERAVRPVAPNPGANDGE